MPKLESVPATEANRTGAVVRDQRQLPGATRASSISTATPRLRLFASSAMCSSISASEWVRR